MYFSNKTALICCDIYFLDSGITPSQFSSLKFIFSSEAFINHVQTKVYSTDYLFLPKLYKFFPMFVFRFFSSSFFNHRPHRIISEHSFGF